MKVLFWFLVALPCVAEWKEIRSPHFTILSEVGPKKGAEVAQNLEQIRAVFDNQFPHLNLDSGKQTIVFVVKNWDGMSRLMPNRIETTDRQFGGMYQPAQVRDFILLRMDASDYLSTIFHEYTHHILRLNYSNLPLWLNEGLAQFFGELKVLKREVRLGTLSQPAARIFRNEPLLNLAMMAEVDHQSPLYNEASKATIFYAMAWQMTHYAYLSEVGRETQALPQLLALAEKGVPAKKALQTVFGDLDALQKVLAKRVKRGRYEALSVKVEARLEKGDFATTDLTQEQFDSHLGALFALSNLGNLDASMVEKLLPLKDQPGVLENLGIMLYRLDQEAQVQTLLTSDAQAMASNWLVNYILSQTTAGNQASQAYLNKAITLNPSFATLYYAQSFALRGSDRELALRHALRAVQLDRGEFRFRRNLAMLLLETKRFDEAIANAQVAIQMATTDSMKDGLVQTIIEPAVAAKNGLAAASRAPSRWSSAGPDARPKSGRTIVKHQGETFEFLKDGERSDTDAPTTLDLQRDSFYETPLIYALWHDDQAQITKLLDQGRGIQERSRYEETPLHLAAERGNLAAVQRLLALGMAHSPTDLGGFTPLMLAAREGHAEILQALHEAGASLEATDKGGTTALMWAGFFGQMKAVKFLLNRRVDKTRTDENGHTAIDYVNHRVDRKIHVLMYQLGIRPGPAGAIGGTQARREIYERRFANVF